MNFLELAKSRYATKRYDGTEKISDEKIKQLKEILRLSPSSINSQPWRFVFVSDAKTKRELASVSYFNEKKINEASHLIVFSVISGKERFERQILSSLPDGSMEYYNTFLKPLSETEIKFWLQHQVYLSLGFFLSACASLGIDSSPMEGVKNEEYDRILKLDGYKTLFAVAIGIRNPTDGNQPSVKPKLRLPSEHVIRSL